MRNQKRLYRWLVVLILAVTLGGVGVMFLCAPSAGVTKENYAKIHEGMTREEAEEILGVAFWGRENAFYFDGRLPPWASEQIFIGVTFTEDNRVEKKEMHVSERTWKARLTEWLPW
jgi:hypothetical protein